ncbi:protein NO VEIN domain-containing protein [Rhizobium leguminosarum]|uniref:protein NO VEIN domain-containing protein n=1 Tax=Rhizobium leguminosarum TaxID=384 RepID=UPI00037E1E8B|nr:DUF3883 domain-containing protein [Rhizobium leguminosarum]
MQFAIEWLTARGWAIRDVSALQSYDLDCHRSNEMLRVEVKGTTGDGSQIVLTRAEKDLAESDPRDMALIVVSEIVLTHSISGVIASGGMAKVIHP